MYRICSIGSVRISGVSTAYLSYAGRLPLEQDVLIFRLP